MIFLTKPNYQKMKLNENAYVIKKMIGLITAEKTGSPSEFSSMLGISRSQFYVEIDELNSLGANIQYDRRRYTFFLHGDKKVIVREPILVIDEDELPFINGGFSTKKPSVLFSGRSNAILAG
jgi:biotin operon repressor